MLGLGMERAVEPHNVAHREHGLARFVPRQAKLLLDLGGQAMAVV
jgi:hypothetical protein